MIAADIKIEEEEDGFHLRIETTEDDSVLDFWLSEPEQLYDQCRSRIGPWLRERDEARERYAVRWEIPVFHCGPDESGGYDISDPKHPNFHYVHADIWDSQEGK